MDSARQKTTHAIDGLAEELGKTFYGTERFKGPLRSRERYIHALSVIVEYIGKNGIHPLICLELNELVLGLIELNKGKVRHFLKPEKSHSKAVDADDIWRARAFLAIAVDLMVVGGLKRKPASREIAGKTKDIAMVLSKPGGEYAVALEQWHIAFEKQKVKSSGALAVFNDRQRIADIYRKKLNDRVSVEMVEKLVIDSFLRDATFAAVRAANQEQLAGVKAARNKAR